jgi:serine/threonine-protein phosphatase 4 regulatory subunit 1
VNDF